MSLSYVGGFAAGSAGTTSYTVSLSGTLTGGSDSSPSPDDIVVVMAGEVFTTPMLATITVSGDINGTYNLLTSDVGNDTRDTYSKNYYFVQGTTPDSALTITKTADSGAPTRTFVQVWRGVDLTNPIDVTSLSAAGMNSSYADAPSITPATAGAVIVYGGFGSFTTGTAVYTNVNAEPIFNASNQNGTSRRIAGFMSAHTGWASGAYDPVAETGTQTSANEAWTAHIMVLRPAASGGSTGQIKVWNGSVFTPKPIKVWDGTSWVVKPLKRWNGTTWVETPY